MLNDNAQFAVQAELSQINEQPCDTSNIGARNFGNCVIKTADMNGSKQYTGRPGDMVSLFKAFSNDRYMYNGSTEDNFDRKYMLSSKRCDQAYIAEDESHRAFLIMLAGHTQQYYFNFLKGKKLNLIALEHAIKSRFITTEKTGILICEWESISLTGIMVAHPSRQLLLYAWTHWLKSWQIFR